MDIFTAFSKENSDNNNSDEEANPPPFASAKGLYNTIDSTELGDVPWQAFSIKYNGNFPEGKPPTWMMNTHEVWYRDPLKVMENQLGNQDFGREMDFAPKQVFDKDNKHQYSNLMSGNWAWEQAVCTILSFKTPSNF